MVILNIKLSDLQPSQFYISEFKIEAIEKWFKADLSNFEPIPVKQLGNDLVMTDGHTRAVVCLKHGINLVPLIFDEDDLDWDMYKVCVEECKKRNVLSPTDLLNRIISNGEYHEKWDKWCDLMQEEVIKKRDEQHE